jgi:hypothetical protein
MQPEACMPLINRTVSIYHERELRRPVRKTEYLISPSTLPNSYSSHVGPPSLSLPLTEANLRRINLTTPFSCAHRPAEIVKQFTPPRLFKETFTLATPFRGESSANYTLTTPFRLPPPSRKSEAIHDYSNTLLIELLSPCARRIIYLPIRPKLHPPKDNSLVLVGYLSIAP